MSDDIDRAQDEVERATAEAMKMRKSDGPRPTGMCHYCGEILDDVARWCDIGCRDAWQELPSHLR